jgi:hypothetical protein
VFLYCNVRDFNFMQVDHARRLSSGVRDEFKQDTEDSKVIDLASLDSLPIIDTGAAIPTIDATTETWIIADIVSVSACTCM